MRDSQGTRNRLILTMLGGLLATAALLWLAAAAPVAGQSPGTLPVYKMLLPAVTGDTALDLGNRFNELNATDVLSRATHRGTQSLVLVNESKGLIFEQFGASGGFNAFHNQAFGDGSVKGALSADDAKALACDFLTSRGLFPGEASFIDCAVGGANLPYQTILGQSTILTPAVGAAAAVSTTQEIGIIVQVPLEIDVDQTTSLPLRGPGGHLSLLFVSTDQKSSPPLLDNDYPGLAALAEPWFGRQLQSLGGFPVLPAVQATQLARARLQQEFVGASSIDPGTPELVFWADDPAAEQDNLMPMWLFEDATATVDGETLNARGFTLPAVQGFLPEVEITSPPDGTQFWAGRPFTLTGQIQGGAGGGPYAYRWLLEDDTVLSSGDTNGGAVQLVTTSLPFMMHAGTPGSVTVRLEATDQNDATAADSIMLAAGPRQTYLPVIARVDGGAATGAGAVPDISIAAPPYRMGVEWVQFYNGTAGDLGGTPPDANGFYNGLAGLGWSGVFKWSNNSAWEKDWRDCSLGGGDCTYGVDRADFAYFSGHGSVARIYFGVNKDSYNFYGGNARFQNLRWVSFSSCNTIRGTDIGHWFNAFQGAHMLLGFHSVMADIAFGGPLVDRMKLPTYWFPFIGWQEFPSLQPTIRDAWVQTAFAMNAGRPSYIYAVGTNGVDPSNNKLPKGNQGNLPRPYPVASWHWVWWSLPDD